MCVQSPAMRGCPIATPPRTGPIPRSCSPDHGMPRFAPWSGMPARAPRPWPDTSPNTTQLVAELDGESAERSTGPGTDVDEAAGQEVRLIDSPGELVGLVGCEGACGDGRAGRRRQAQAVELGQRGAGLD